MSRKTVSKPEPKTSTGAIADLSPSETKVTQVRGGAVRTVDGEATTKDHSKD